MRTFDLTPLSLPVGLMDIRLLDKLGRSRSETYSALQHQRPRREELPHQRACGLVRDDLTIEAKEKCAPVKGERKQTATTRSCSIAVIASRASKTPLSTRDYVE